MVAKREESAENRRAEERREKVLFVRLSEAEHRMVKRAARFTDTTAGEWGRAVLVDRAEKVIATAGSK